MLARVGDLSYSLYLVHWPLFAFFHNAWIGEPGAADPTVWRLGLVALALALAWLLHRFVEAPLRYFETRRAWRSILPLVAAPAALVLLAVALARPAAGARDYALLRRPNRGFAFECNQTDTFKPLPACRNSGKPQTLVWGDSYAMHLIPAGLAKAPGAPPMVQATRSVCGPLVGVGVVDRDYDRAWAESCIRFNDSVLSYLKRTPSIDVVVLASTFGQYLRPGGRALVRAKKGAPFAPAPTDRRLALAGVRRTVRAVRALGRRAVAVSPPPSSGFDSSLCAERLERGLPVLGVAHGCRISQAAYRKARRLVLELLDEAARGSDLPVVGFDDALCRDGLCDTVADGVFLYRDAGHLSPEGAAYLWRTMPLVEKVRAAAR